MHRPILALAKLHRYFLPAPSQLPAGAATPRDFQGHAIDRAWFASTCIIFHRPSPSTCARPPILFIYSYPKKSRSSERPEQHQTCQRPPSPRPAVLKDLSPSVWGCGSQRLGTPTEAVAERVANAWAGWHTSCALAAEGRVRAPSGAGPAPSGALSGSPLAPAPAPGAPAAPAATVLMADDGAPPPPVAADLLEGGVLPSKKYRNCSLLQASCAVPVSALWFPALILVYRWCFDNRISSIIAFTAQPSCSSLSYPGTRWPPQTQRISGDLSNCDI